MKGSKFFLIALALVAAVAVFIFLKLQSQTVDVTVFEGVLRGRVEGAVMAFKGVPYGAVPDGPLRWQPPQAVIPWSGTRLAVKYGSPCVQVWAQKVFGSEDCLTLNVWAPYPLSAESLPVLVFVHGGMGILGSSSDSLTDGTSLSRLGRAVVVTFDYRLGLLGFMAHRSLTETSSEKSSGNLGLADQIQVLKWVRRNISAFGGDPQKVMVFGQSSGGDYVIDLLSSPKAKGLFSSAVVESGRPAVWSLDSAYEIGDRTVKIIGCQNASCLREKPSEDIAAATYRVMRTAEATVDGVYLEDSPLKIISDGNFNSVPVIVGSNLEETKTLLRNVRVQTEADYEKQIEIYAPGKSSKIAARYPASNFGGSYRDALVAALSDFNFHCPARRVLGALAFGSSTPVWGYLYSHVSQEPDYREFGAGHGMELPFVFSNFPEGQSPTPTDLKLSMQLLKTWVRFAETGNPNTDRKTVWSKYDPTKENYTEINDEFSQQEKFREAQCVFLDAL